MKLHYKSMIFIQNADEFHKKQFILSFQKNTNMNYNQFDKFRI